MAINAFPITVIYERLDLRAKMFEIDWFDRLHEDDIFNADQQLLKDLRDRFAEHGCWNPKVSVVLFQSHHCDLTRLQTDSIADIE